ncbi:translation initiation factor eIF-2B subunit [Marinobacter sp. ATCH36]|uniref:translation initiation factor eIF-2B n=1 Tax=Marinobacter sp. ATCH36 TaxID=2945106 RepID=UPI0020222AD7|nr:translation initiation factor eIF-2B subunit [Marinobacter sp. ATCH36]MCL7942682.1 translation initiation factor eIF-2B [Marinobacter sp. ATCH36]
MPGLDDRAQQLLDRLQKDYESGATKLALKTLSDLVAYVKAAQPTPSDLEPLLDRLLEARPSMPVIGNAIGKFKSCIADGISPLAAANQVASELENASSTIVRHARRQIPSNAVIMTHSASSVVLGLFRLLVHKQHQFSVICTQSSPGMEGHQLATALNDLGVPVTLITDAQMGLFVPRADVVVTGCDTWLADGHFINKSGTRLLALAAHAHNKPFWVLGDSFRHSDQTSNDVSLEEMPAEELHAPTGEWITPRNIYFETIPESLITGRINEQGVFSCPGSPQP